MSRSDCINIVYITDQSFAMPTCVSVTSLIANMGENDFLKIFIICDGLPRVSKDFFMNLTTERAHIKLMDIHDERYLRLFESCIYADRAHTTAAALYKLGLPEVLKDVKKVIYLDGDTLVQKSLRAMYEYDLADNYVAAIEDMLDGDKDAEGYSRLSRRIGLYKREYFNSGVMLLNLEKMREDSISQELMAYRENGLNYFMDQDALNMVLSRKRAYLSYIYNFLTTAMDVYNADEIGQRFFGGEKKSIEEYIEAVTILHLTGPRKPWKYCNPWFSEIFLQYYKKSPYRQEKLCLLSPVKELLDTVKEEEKSIREMGNRIRSLESNVTHIMKTREFVVPYERIVKNCRLVLYGAGEVGKCYYKQLTMSGYCEVVLWIDMKGQEANPKAVLPAEIALVEFDCILVAILHKETAAEAARLLVEEYAVDENKILKI